jgi:hypothetical protein
VSLVVQAPYGFRFLFQCGVAVIRLQGSGDSGTLFAGHDDLETSVRSTVVVIQGAARWPFNSPNAAVSPARALDLP